MQRLGGFGGDAELFVPLFRIIVMDTLDLKIRRFLVDEGYLMPITDEEIARALDEVKPKINRISTCGITTHYEAFCPVCKTVFAKRRYRKSLSAYLAKNEHHCHNIPDASVFIYK